MDRLQTNNFYSTSQAAELLDVSRITIFRWIKKGVIEATKVGRHYVISHAELVKHLHKDEPNEQQIHELKNLVDKVILDYGETIRMLGRE